MSEPKPLLAPLRPATTAARLWRSTGFVTDTWTSVADDTALPSEGAIIVSLARWRAERSKLVGREVGVHLAPTDAFDPATDGLDRLSLVALSFPKYTDGRAYSTARRLREHWGFKGEVRATGDVLLDQLPLMLRSGFDTFELTSAATIAALEAGPVPAVVTTYQRSVDVARFGWRPRQRTVDALIAAE